MSTKEYEKNILASLESIGLLPDEKPINQSERGDIYTGYFVDNIHCFLYHSEVSPVGF